jgi:UDP-hydrolysing UDP-N-acetyl-D-glucosamine 2-epimerase
MSPPARHPCRVAVVTGSRAEYGLLRTAMRAIDAEPRLVLQTIVTGMHLLPGFGSTWKHVVADGFRVAARVPMQRGDDGPLDQVRGISRGVAGIAAALNRLKSDVVLVLGDRIEALAAALAANATGRRLAHVHGGDVAPGDRDDRYRHAISQLADLHLAASQDARRRLIGRGIRSADIVVVGAPGLDELRIRTRPRTPGDTALIVQHAYGRAADREARVSHRSSQQRPRLRRRDSCD